MKSWSGQFKFQRDCSSENLTPFWPVHQAQVVWGGRPCQMRQEAGEGVVFVKDWYLFTLLVIFCADEILLNINLNVYIFIFGS